MIILDVRSQILLPCQTRNTPQVSQSVISHPLPLNSRLSLFHVPDTWSPTQKHVIRCWVLRCHQSLQLSLVDRLTSIHSRKFRYCSLLGYICISFLLLPQSGVSISGIVGSFLGLPYLVGVGQIGLIGSSNPFGTQGGLYNLSWSWLIRDSQICISWRTRMETPHERGE